MVSKTIERIPFNCPVHLGVENPEPWRKSPTRGWVRCAIWPVYKSVVQSGQYISLLVFTCLTTHLSIYLASFCDDDNIFCCGWNKAWHYSTKHSRHDTIAPSILVSQLSWRYLYQCEEKPISAVVFREKTTAALSPVIEKELDSVFWMFCLSVPPFIVLKCFSSLLCPGGWVLCFSLGEGDWPLFVCMTLLHSGHLVWYIGWQ